MQTLLKILARYSNFLVFIILEVVAFLLISLNSAYPRSSMLSTANRMVAWQYEMIDEIRDYMHLKRVNADLAAENAMLRSMVGNDAAFHAEYQSAKVVQLTSDRSHNYITINRGEENGLYAGMGVRNAEGVVGIVRTVGSHYSVVQPIINTASQLSCRFAKNDYISTLMWNGRDFRYAQLHDVATHIQVEPGDTIVTSGLSPAFPEDIPVGIVENCTLGKGDSYYTLRVRLFTDFRRLKYVETICNNDKAELENLNNGLE